MNAGVSLAANTQARNDRQIFCYSHTLHDKRQYIQQTPLASPNSEHLFIFVSFSPTIRMFLADKM